MDAAIRDSRQDRRDRRDGHIGRQVARRLQGWDCSIVYYDPIEPPAELVEQLALTDLSMDELLRESDIVTLHTMLNAQTRGMIGTRELRMMKPTAVVINTCRGGVVDEAALIRALRDGEIAGAALVGTRLTYDLRMNLAWRPFRPLHAVSLKPGRSWSGWHHNLPGL